MGSKIKYIALAGVGVLAYRAFKKKLSNLDYWIAAQQLGCDAAAIKAVAYIESNGIGFTDAGIKTRLESQFLTNYQLQYNVAPKSFLTFKSAYDYNKQSAVLSTSFGIFQIMGFNYKICGYSSPLSFYYNLSRGAVPQLNAFVAFCKERNLGRFLKNKDWQSFAYYYNGAGYKANNYDTKLNYYYNKFK